MAVINRTVRFLKSIRQKQGIVLFFVLCGVGLAYSNPRGCDTVKTDVEAKGFSPSLVLERPAIGPICSEDSCCQPQLENVMLRHSQLHVDKFLKENIMKISTVIDVRAKKFDDFFREMLNKSKLEFHEMFERTYGKIYLQNSDVFSDFFDELESYYKKGSVRLSETLDTFFGILYQRMFTVINSQYSFDDKYLNCVSERMEQLKPFGDVPHKLSLQLRRSFVATRTFYKSLVKGADVAIELSKVKIEEQCFLELNRMQFCGVCKGQQGVGACSSYCTYTMENCFKMYTEFSTVWDNFIDAIDKVGERLLGPYNIELVVEPLNIKISEAIMNFQESGTEVSKKIYEVCGKPTLTRPKRKAEYPETVEDNPNYELKPHPLKHGKKKKKQNIEKVDNTPSLEKLISEIKQKIKETKQFWLHLPYLYCNNKSIAASRQDEGNCWNGTSLGTYTKPEPKTGGYQSAIIEEQIYTLNVLADNLRKAHQGQEVELVDDTDEPSEGSGSGSGYGGLEEDEFDETGVATSDNNDVIDETKPVVPDGDVREVPVASSTKMPEVVRTSGSASTNSMSLTRALIQYILPIVLAWFGGAISDCL